MHTHTGTRIRKATKPLRRTTLIFRSCVRRLHNGRGSNGAVHRACDIARIVLGIQMYRRATGEMSATRLRASGWRVRVLCVCVCSECASAFAFAVCVCVLGGNGNMGGIFGVGQQCRLVRTLAIRKALHKTHTLLHVVCVYRMSISASSNNMHSMSTRTKKTNRAGDPK